MSESRKVHSFLSLGSNMGNRRAHMAHADYLLSHNPRMEVLRRSSILDNPPLLVEEQPSFLNQIVEIQTDLEPLELLDTLKEYEKEIGRIKRIRYGPREIDLDILSYDGLRMNNSKLTLPHPGLRDREYLRILLAEFELQPEDLLNQATRRES
ncbi:MAG: 2-amino-4-hydroxy-6-hydroxymethyldihydropteridine diphosphokinase [Leptospiraceae bacterium]|nr:2-amino-4-hydroxy-6-hydroxymethyldihydropteridine diphosphokinase [Leptospiraceae bacterium]